MSQLEIDLGKGRLQTGDFAGALALFEEHLRSESKSEEVRLLRAICLTRLRRAAEARTALQLLIDDHPNYYEALTFMAELSRSSSDFETAAQWATRAIAVASARAEAYGVLGTCYARMEKHDLAITALEKAVELEPDSARYRVGLASSYGAVHRHRKAAEQMQVAIRIGPPNPAASLALSSSLMRLGLAEKALDALDAGLRIAPENSDLQTATAVVYTVLRNDRLAEHHHQLAATSSSEGKTAYALWLVEQGRFEEAGELYEKLIKEYPRMGLAYYGLLQCRKGESIDEKTIAKMEMLLEETDLAPQSRMYLCFALADILEQRANYERAIGLYDEANRLAIHVLPFTTPPFRPIPKRIEGDRAIRRFEQLRVGDVWGTTEGSPLLIIGMPRSGTTLLDQILSSHPLVASGGELRYWIENGSALAAQDGPISEKTLRLTSREYLELLSRVGGPKERQTDKMPGNYLYAGIIHRALPNARFLHIRRHPIDTCLSVYTTFLGTGGNMPYSKESIVAYYKEYLRIMAYWRNTLPANRLLEIDYESLISSPAPTIRKIVEFCGLPWDDVCLSHEKNRSAINTPSRWQARQPIYQSSVERWRKYEPWLGELAELFRYVSVPNS